MTAVKKMVHTTFIYEQMSHTSRYNGVIPSTCLTVSNYSTSSIIITPTEILDLFSRHFNCQNPQQIKCALLYIIQVHSNCISAPSDKHDFFNYKILKLVKWTINHVNWLL